MSKAKARNLIYWIWGGFFLAYIVLFEFAPSFRRGFIDQEDAHAGLIKLAALYVPVMTSFASFWFRLSPSRISGTVPKERWLPAIGTTLAYHGVLFVLLFYALYLDPYPTRNGQPLRSFNQWVVDILQIGLFLSPVATAPAAYLLGVESIPVSPPSGR
jgi:hypothetical protein